MFFVVFLAIFLENLVHTLCWNECSIRLQVSLEYLWIMWWYFLAPLLSVNNYIELMIGCVILLFLIDVYNTLWHKQGLSIWTIVYRRVLTIKWHSNNYQLRKAWIFFFAILPAPKFPKTCKIMFTISLLGCTTYIMLYVCGNYSASILLLCELLYLYWCKLRCSLIT